MQAWLPRRLNHRQDQQNVKTADKHRHEIREPRSLVMVASSKSATATPTRGMKIYGPVPASTNVSVTSALVTPASTGSGTTWPDCHILPPNLPEGTGATLACETHAHRQ